MYDIFISYRRKGGYETAKHLYDLLVRDGYTVSFDIDTLRNGDFDTALLKRIEECTDFILILNKGAFDRTLDPNFNPKNDWMRNELAYALKLNKNVIPIMLEGFDDFPEDLPDDICNVVRKNGPKYDNYYFDDFYRKMKKSFFETPEPKPSDREFKHELVCSSVKFKTNISCHLLIDGEYKQRVEEDTLTQISLSQGEYFFEFISVYNAGVDKDSRKVKLTGEDIVFEVDLKSIEDRRTKLEQEALKVINTRYDSFEKFQGGLCLAKRNGLYGYLNVKLEEVIPFIYEFAEEFEGSYGTAVVQRYGKYGTINLQGKQIIPLEYDKLKGEKHFDSVTSKTYIRCSKNGRCGVLDQFGEIVLPIEYDNLGDILSEHCIIVSCGKAGLYDLKNNKIALPAIYDKLILYNTYAIFYTEGHCGLYLLDGSLITKACYDEIHSFSEDLAPVRIGKLWGYINKSGKLAISPKYDETKPFSCGLAAVRKNDKWAYIDHSFKEVIGYKYDEAGTMLAGAAIVKTGDTAGVINRVAAHLYPMTKGIEFRHSTLAYDFPDTASPILAVFPDNSLELISPQGKIFKLTKEHYYTYCKDDYSTIFLTFNNVEHMFTDTIEELSEHSLSKYDIDDVISLAILFNDESNTINYTDSQLEVCNKVKSIIAKYLKIESSVVEFKTNLYSELGAADDDMTDIMMQIENELGVQVDSESYFRSLDTVQEMADYIIALLEAGAAPNPAPIHEEQVSVQEEQVPVQTIQTQVKYKRGDIYVHNGVEGIVLSYNESAGEVKLVTRNVRKSYWEDPSFGGIFKKLSVKVKNMPPDEYPHGVTNTNAMKSIKKWDFKYPALWICSTYGPDWFLPAICEFNDDFRSPEVQAQLNKLAETDYWTSNTHKENNDEAFVTDGQMSFCASRNSLYPVVAMCYVKVKK